MKKGAHFASASDDETPPLGEVLDFMRMLWSIDHGLQTTSKRMEATLGVTGLQRMVLRLVGRFPGISAGHLARILHVHPSTLTGVLKRLEDRQLVTRSADPLDARRALFTLTGKGRTLDIPSTGTVEASVQRALERVPQAKINAARELLQALSEELGTEPISLSLGGSRPARSGKPARGKR
jgi:MarR family transcriptional regulator, organic hydroperoxide resistance regulator